MKQHFVHTSHLLCQSAEKYHESIRLPVVACEMGMNDIAISTALNEAAGCLMAKQGYLSGTSPISF
jgi:hypothetical protein